MRTDEHGDPCPSTSGEYRDLCCAFMPNSQAVQFCDDAIAAAQHGRDEIVLASDYSMRQILMPLLLKVV